MIKRIGGYFGLELNSGKEYHTEAIRLNTGRNALEYLLISKQIEKIYIPIYTCDVLLQPIKHVGVHSEFYQIDKNFEPVFDFSQIQQNEYFLYTNYFGLKSDFVSLLAKKCENLIVDSAQAFYANPITGVDTFYSPRKFFGIADGAYLFTNKKMDKQFDSDTSFHRFEHLLRRIDMGAEEGYTFFLNEEKTLNDLPILKMSNLTQAILRSINYSEIAQKRRDNYGYLNGILGGSNKLEFVLSEFDVPMTYPYYTTDTTLRMKLIENKIFSALYWPNVLSWSSENSVERDYAENIVHIPIDQRIEKFDLERVIKIITE